MRTSAAVLSALERCGGIHSGVAHARLRPVSPDASSRGKKKHRGKGRKSSLPGCQGKFSKATFFFSPGRRWTRTRTDDDVDALEKTFVRHIKNLDEAQARSVFDGNPTHKGQFLRPKIAVGGPCVAGARNLGVSLCLTAHVLLCRKEGMSCTSWQVCQRRSSLRTPMRSEASSSSSPRRRWKQT
jgi:hypothetical protein